MDENVDRFKQVAVRVFNVETEGKTDKEVALEGVDKLREFWSSLGAPTRLADYDIGEDKLDLMADRAMAKGEFGKFKKLNKEDVLAILRASL